MTASDPSQSQDSAAQIEQGTYEILRGRLEEHAATLRERATGLNEKRLEIFGGSEMTVVGNERIRTANNCVPRDIRTLGDLMLFGYNVFLGLRAEIRVEDVFSLHSFSRSEDGGGGFAFDPIAPDDPRNFLADAKFVSDFEELYRYYKDARLIQLRRLEDGKLLAIFQIGAAEDDTRVFRWAVSPDGEVTYLDNRGERDHVLPPSHDFEWTATTRDDHVLGRHPHVSILDKVFVETVGGDLTVKVEDNTEDGLGIYRELVEEANQSLADAEILYAEIGPLILLKVLPYNEQIWRYLVFNTRTRKVDRIDAIGQACQMLPEDHGVIFPGGYYLQDGTTKTFEGDVSEMLFMKTVRSPNGEDVLFVFYERAEGRLILLNYNLIRKEVQNPIHCNGMAIFDDGLLVQFRSTGDEPTRVHPMQIWQTPFVSQEHAARAPSTGSFLEKVGNAELVRGISDALSICRSVTEQEPSVAGYEELIAETVRTDDAYYWLDDSDEIGDLQEPLAEIRRTADLIVGEFAKVQAIKRQAREAVESSAETIEQLFHRLRSEPRQSVDHYVTALADLRRERGRLITLREQRYVDLERVEDLDARLVESFDQLSTQTVDYLLAGEALEPYHREIEQQVARAEEADKTTDAAPIAERLDDISSGLELLTEVVGSLEIDDPTQRTSILEGISEVLSSLNRGRAVVEARRKELLSVEGRAEFGAQFQLLSQSVSGALAMADTPEKCEEQLSKLMLQLEDLEGRFSEFDDFLDQLSTKREDIYEAFASKKQTLLDERQRKAGRMVQAAGRILEGIARRAASLADADALNTYFVGDAMVAKIRTLAGDLRELGESVRADELESRLKSAKEEATRSLRDRQDIYEDGAEIIKLGRHRFSVNTQAFDLTMVPRAGRDGETEMSFYLTGTDFYDPIEDPDFLETRGYWDQLLVSETEEVYRAEFLAASMLFDAEEGRAGLSLDLLSRAVAEENQDRGGLAARVRDYAAERYDEGYERGVHDHDAARILEPLLSLYRSAGLLRFAPRPRALACLFWAFYGEQTSRVQWERRCRSLARLRSAFTHSPAIRRLCGEIAQQVSDFMESHGLEASAEEARMAAAYLFEELSKHPVSFTTSGEAEKLRDAFLQHLDLHQNRRDFDEDLRELEDDLRQRFGLAHAWLSAYLKSTDDERIQLLAPSLDEAAVLLVTPRRLERTVTSARQAQQVEGLLGQHPRVRERSLDLRLDEFLARLTAFSQRRVPGFRNFQKTRHSLLEEERERLRLDEYRPKVMSAFVRNQLISEVYLPIIGDNLAKQMGTVGEGKRTDQMGLLLLISPPGYGKTTLMEYVANRLGLIFVKVNGPALGHGVLSLDPSEAPNATARQEVEKINFALEMGNNVLLYLDDIQHTHSELLQKFISLCDAQRRIEGVWNGRTRTYDLKGKRFAVCMAGNPYTESGEAFQIPDMLANRADTYNLGDILEGRDQVFALSYIENSLTSNPALAPLAGRDPGDVEKLVRIARGEAVQTDQLSHAYSAVELDEIRAVLSKMLRVQEVVLAVNQQYIASAAQDDAFRTEPRFQLQGSYRNMNKMSEKVVAVMNDAELEAMIDDHYAGEAQTLTTGAEANLLKLGELRGTMNERQMERWREIKRGFARVQTMGGAEDDPAIRLLGQLGMVGDRLADIDQAIHAASTRSAESAEAEEARAAQAAEEQEAAAREPSAGVQLAEALTPYLSHLRQAVDAMVESAAAQPAAAATPAAAGQPAERETALELARAIGGPLEEAVAALGELLERRPPLPQQATGAAPAVAGGASIAPYLDRLDETMNALVSSRPAAVVQTLTPGVIDIFDRLAESVDDDLMPAVKILDKVRRSVAREDRGLEKHLERTLHHLDSLRELVLSLRRLDTTVHTASSARQQ
ncbi:MAG: DNA repair ATPase [Acidobacteriota bacterium]